MCFIGGWLGEQLDDFKDNVLDDFLGFVPGKGGLVGDLLQDADEFLFHGGLEDFTLDLGRKINEEIFEPAWEYLDAYLYYSGQNMDFSDSLWDMAKLTVAIIYPPALPFVTAAAAKDQGADWDEALLEGAKVAVGQQISQGILDSDIASNVAGGLEASLTAAGISGEFITTFTEATGKIFTSGLAEGSVALLEGDSFSDGFVAGAIFETAQMGTDAVMNFVDERTDGYQFKTDKTQGAKNNIIATDGQPLYNSLPDGSDDLTSIRTDANGLALKAQEVYNTMPAIVQNVLARGVQAKLQGQEVTDFLLAEAAFESLITAEALGELIEPVFAGTGLDVNTDDGRLFMAFLAPAVQRSAAAITTMGFGAESALISQQSFSQVLDQYSSAQLFNFTKDAIQNTSIVQGLLSQLDGLTGKTEAVELAAQNTAVTAAQLSEARAPLVDVLNQHDDKLASQREAREAVISTAEGQLMLRVISEYTDAVIVEDDPNNPDKKIYTIKEGADGDIARAYNTHKEAYEGYRELTPTYVDAAGVTREYAPYAQIAPMINTYKESITEWNAFVAENKNILENSESVLAPYKQAYENAATQLQLDRDALYAETDSLGDYFDAELQTLLQSDYVQVIQPDFDETFYTNLYGPQIDAGMTAQQHWLATGAANNYLVSQSQRDALEQSMINRFKYDTIETVYGEGNLSAFEKSDPTKRAALNTSINNYINANFYDALGDFKFDSITEYKYFDEDGNEIPTFVEGARVERYANQEYVAGLMFVDNEFNSYLQQSSGLSLEEYVNQLNTVPSPVATPLMLDASISSYSGQQVNDYFNDLLLYGGIGLDAVTGQQEYVSSPTAGAQYQFNPFTGERETLLTNGVSFASLADSDPSGFFSTAGDLLGNWFQTWSEATGAAYQSKAEYDQGRRAFINEQMASGAEVGKKWWWSTIDVLSNASANATETAMLNNVPGAELQYKVNVDANGDVVSLFSQQNAPDNRFVYYNTKEDVPREFLPYASLDYKRNAGGQIITDVANIAKVEEKKLDINNYFNDVWDRVRMTDVYTLAGAEGLLSWVQNTFVAGTGYFINMDAQEILDNPVYKWFDVATQVTEAARLTIANQFDPTYATNLEAMNSAFSPINLTQRAVDDPATPYINETVWDTMAIFGDNYQAYPTEFIAEVLFKESVEELGPFAAGVAVKKGVEAFPEISSNVAAALGLGTAFSLEVAESAGGEYVGNFEEAKAVIAQVLRDRRASNQDVTWTSQQIDIMADHYAQGIARETATYAGMLTAAMFFAGGGALDQSAMRRMGIPPDVLSDLGRKLNNDFLIKNGTNAFSNGAAVVSKEILSEYVEEYSIANKFESLIYKWDNTRNIPGNVQFAGQFGALIAGTATTAGILFYPGVWLTDKDGNSYAEEFDIPTFSEATGRLEYKPTGNLAADFLLANVPEIATAVYTGNASSIDSILPTLGITGDVATALADAANDPYYADTIYRLPSPSPGFIDPDFNTFPVGTNNELYYDPTSAGTYKFKDGNWARTGNGNQTVADWKSYNEYGTIVDVTMPTFEQVKRSIQLTLNDREMLEGRFTTIDGLSVQGFNFPDHPSFPGNSHGYTLPDAVKNSFHPADFIPENWESLTYDQLLPYYTGFRNIQELVFVPSPLAVTQYSAIDPSDGLLYIYNGEPYIPPGQTEPGFMVPGWDGVAGARSSDESIPDQFFEGIENQLITDPNTGDQYLVSVTFEEGQNAMESTTRLTKWITDAPSAYEVWDKFTTDDQGSWVIDGGVGYQSDFGSGGKRLRYLPPVTIAGGSALNTRNGEGMFGGWEAIYGPDAPSDRDMEYRRTNWIEDRYGNVNNIPELLQDGKGQTLGGMETMINNAAGYVMMATSEADFEQRMEDYSTVYEAYWPYIARERAKYGLKNQDTVNEAFYGGSIPLRIKTINPYDVTGVEEVAGSELYYSDGYGYNLYHRAGRFTQLPTSEYVNNLLYPDGLLADGEGNFTPKVTDFPVAPTNTAPEKWWDQENHHRYYAAYDSGISHNGNSTDAEGLFIPVSEEMAVGSWSAELTGTLQIESGRFTAGSVPWQWLVNPAFHTEPEHGEVTTFSYIRNNSLGVDHSGYGGLGYKGIWIHPFEKDARGDGLQYVYKNGQWRAAWYWHPAVDDDGQWIPYDEEGGTRKGLKVNTGVSNLASSDSYGLPIWTSGTNDAGGQIPNFNKPYRSDRDHVWGHTEYDEATAGDYPGENATSPGLGATTEEFLTNIGFTGSYDDFTPAARARLQTPYSSSDQLALPPGMIDPIAQQEEYEQAQFDYFISKSVENGWSVPDANYYVFKNGRDILNVMDGMQSTDDFDAYFVNNADQAQTFNGIDPSPTLTLSSYKRLFTDTYGLSEEEFYAMHRSPSLGMTNEAVDDTLNNYVFNQVEDPNKLDAFGNPIIGMRGNSDFVQNFVANNINTREDIIAKYKTELGQSYEPTEAEINQYLGYRYKLDDNGDHDLHASGNKKQYKLLNNIDLNYFTDVEREDAVERRLTTLEKDTVRSNFFELNDPIKRAQFKDRLIDLYQHDSLISEAENQRAFDTLVNDTINNEYNQNLRRRNAASQLRTQLFIKDARGDEEYKKYPNINVSTYDEDQETWIEANFGAALDAYYDADPTKYTVPITDIKTLIENYEATEKAKLTAVLPGRSTLVDELFRVNGTVADAQKLADIVTNFEAKWGYTPSEKDLYILGANAGLSVSGIKNTNNTFGLFNSFATGGRQVNNYFAAQNAFRTIKEEFEKYGYTPDDAEIRGYMNAVNTNLGGVTTIPVLDQNVIAQIEAYVAPKILDAGEVKGLLENAGITAAEFEARFGYDPISRYTDTRIDSFDAGFSPLENDISTFVADRDLQTQRDYNAAEYNRIAAEFSKYGIDIYATEKANDLAGAFFEQDLADVEQVVIDNYPTGTHVDFLKRSRLVEYFEMAGEAIPSEQDLQTMIDQMTGTTKAELTDTNQISTIATTYLAAQTYDTSDVRRDLAAELGIEENLIPADFNDYITNLAAEELTDGGAAGRIAGDIANAETAFGLYDESPAELAEALDGTIADVPTYLEDKQYTLEDAKADLRTELGLAADADVSAYNTYLFRLVDMTGATPDADGEIKVQGDITGSTDLRDYLQNIKGFDVGRGEGEVLLNPFTEGMSDALGLGVDLDTTQSVIDYMDANEITGDEIRNQIVTETGVNIYEEDGTLKAEFTDQALTAAGFLVDTKGRDGYQAAELTGNVADNTISESDIRTWLGNNDYAAPGAEVDFLGYTGLGTDIAGQAGQYVTDEDLVTQTQTTINNERQAVSDYFDTAHSYFDEDAAVNFDIDALRNADPATMQAAVDALVDDQTLDFDEIEDYFQTELGYGSWVPRSVIKGALLGQPDNPDFPTPRQLTAGELNESGQLDSVANIAQLPDQTTLEDLVNYTTISPEEARAYLKGEDLFGGPQIDVPYSAAVVDALSDEDLATLGLTGNYGWQGLALPERVNPVDPENITSQGDSTNKGAFLASGFYNDQNQDEDEARAYLAGLGLTQATELNDPADPDSGYKVDFATINNLADNSLEGRFDATELARRATLEGGYFDQNEVTFDEIREQIANELGVAPATLYDENGDPIAGYTDTDITAAGFTQGVNVVETGLGTEITDNVLTSGDIENHLSGLGYSAEQIANFDSSGIAWNDTTALDELTADFQTNNRNTTQQAIAADLETNFGWLNATDADIAAVADLDAAGRTAWVGDRRFTSTQAATALANVGVPTDHPEYNNLLTALTVDQDRTGSVPATQAALVDSVEDPLLDPFFIDPGEVATEFGNYTYFEAPTDLLPFTGLIDDTGLPTTIETYVNENYVTADEARAALDGVAGVDAYARDDQDNYIITDQQLLDAELTGQYVDTVENQALAGRVGNLTTDEAEARDLLIAQGVVNPSATDIQNYMGFTPEAPTFTPTDIADLRYRGILDQFGTPAVYSDTETDLDGNPVLVTPATGIYAEIDSLRGQGLDADAIGTAISTYIGGLGLPTSGDLDTLEGEIQNYIGEQGFFTGDATDIQRIVSDVIGKPAELVTQEDIDYVNNIIQGNIGVQDPTYDSTNLGLYDVNSDGFINVDDKNLLDQLYAGQDAEYNQYVAGIDPTSQFADTGIFDTLAYEREQDRLAEIARQTEIDAQTQTNINLQTQINAQRLATQEAEQKQLLTALAASQPPQQQMKQEEPELAEMGPRYDFSTIFSTPEVAAQKAAVSPYGGFRQKAAATGGLITNETDELLALLEEIG